MKKSFYLLVIVLLLSNSDIYAQRSRKNRGRVIEVIDNYASTPTNAKTMMMRIYAGPEMCFMYEGEYSEMKGGQLGFNAGLEFNKKFTETTHGIFGFNVVSTGFDRWVEDPSSAAVYAVNRGVGFEVPLGVGFNFGKNKPQGFYTNFMGIVSFMTTSSAQFFTLNGTTPLENNKLDNTFDPLNLGAKMEIGLKTKTINGTYYGFGWTNKVMFMDRLARTNANFTTLHTAIIGSYYF